LIPDADKFVPYYLTIDAGDRVGQQMIHDHIARQSRAR